MREPVYFSEVGATVKLFLRHIAFKGGRRLSISAIALCGICPQHRQIGLPFPAPAKRAVPIARSLLL